MTVTRKCVVCGEIMVDGEPEGAHTLEACAAEARRNVNMKPLLSVAITEAVHLALIDSVALDLTDEQQEAARWDMYAIPSEAIAKMDPGALAQNVCVRLLGGGGWFVNGVYAGNATPRQVFDASIQRPDRDEVAEVAFDLGLRPSDEPS